MSIYSKPENFKSDLWHYRKYIEFVTFYGINDDKAEIYAEMIEEHNSNIFNKQRLANIYQLNGKNKKAIKKLEEIKDLYEDPQKKNEIDKQISEIGMLWFTGHNIV